MRTQVAIVGAGPAGLLLAQLLHNEGIDSIVVENRSREYVEGRIRAGVLEQGAVDILNAAGVGDRMRREGLVHDGFEMRFHGQSHRIDLARLTGGKCITVYGQHEVVKDLIAARVATGRPLLFDVADVRVTGIDTKHPAGRVHARRARATSSTATSSPAATASTASAGAAMPAHILRIYEKVYPFAWLGILVDAPPVQNELVYAYHDRGFALFSMRSPTITRLYVQCAPEDELSEWPDARIWHELHTRLETKDGWKLQRGPMLQRGITPMRSFVAEPMRHGRLFLAGDAAHIVPPTGAKGMNLAVGDVAVLGTRPGRALRRRARRSARPLLRDLPAAGVEGRALLVAHDVDAPPLSGQRRVPVADAARRARLLHRVRRRAHDHRRELRRAADRAVTITVGVRSNFGEANLIALPKQGCTHDAPAHADTPSTKRLIEAGGWWRQNEATGADRGARAPIATPSERGR